MSLSKVIHYYGTACKQHFCCLMLLLSVLGFAQKSVTDIAVVDTTFQDSVIEKKDVLVDKIKRHADGYMIVNRKENKLYMYDGAELYYQDSELKSGVIVLDYTTNEVSAGRIKDSLGNFIQPPVFKQGVDEIFPDSIRFNFDSKKAIIWNSRSDQQGMNVKATATKKQNERA